MKILISIFILLFSINLNAQSAGLTTKDTNVYNEPSLKSTIVEKVPANTIMLLGAIKNEFIGVSYINIKNEFKIGWVLFTNIKIHNQQSSKSSSGYCDDYYSTYEGANFCLTIDHVDFDCDESIFDDGYDSCEVEIDVSYTSDYNGSGEPSVSITCEAEVETTDSSNWTSTESDYEYTTSYGRDGWESLDIDIDVSSVFDTILRVSLEDVDCVIDSVY